MGELTVMMLAVKQAELKMAEKKKMAVLAAVCFRGCCSFITPPWCIKIIKNYFYKKANFV